MDGYKNIVIGYCLKVSGHLNEIIGDYNYIQGEHNNIHGHNITLHGNINLLVSNNSLLLGNDNKISGDKNLVHGQRNNINGRYSTVCGNSNTFRGSLVEEEEFDKLVSSFKIEVPTDLSEKLQELVEFEKLKREQIRTKTRARSNKSLESFSFETTIILDVNTSSVDSSATTDDVQSESANVSTKILPESSDLEPTSIENDTGDIEGRKVKKLILLHKSSNNYINGDYNTVNGNDNTINGNNNYVNGNNNTINSDNNIVIGDNQEK